ncbi:MAG: hypothetical protein HY762_07720 [Planctomycetes bacterium]|nr:hypothetical protein [Planctomycetota bacterium]
MPGNASFSIKVANICHAGLEVNKYLHSMAMKIRENLDDFLADLAVFGLPEQKCTKNRAYKVSGLSRFSGYLFNLFTELLRNGK